MSGDAVRRLAIHAILTRSLALAQSRTVADDETIQTLGLADLTLHPDQPRRYFDPAARQELVEGVLHRGILHPLLARPMDDGKYQVVVGEHDYLAAQLAGLTHVPVLVHSLSDDEAEIIASAENLQHEGLNRYDEVWHTLVIVSKLLGYDRVSTDPIQQEDAVSKLRELRRKPQSNPELIEQIETLFSQLGREQWMHFVSSGLPVLNLPHVLTQALREGTLDYSKAVLISRSPQHGQEQLLTRTLQENLSLDALRVLIREEHGSTANPKEDLNRLLTPTRIDSLSAKRRLKLDRLIREIRQLFEEGERDQRMERSGARLAVGLSNKFEE